MSVFSLGHSLPRRHPRSPRFIPKQEIKVGWGQVKNANRDVEGSVLKFFQILCSHEKVWGRPQYISPKCDVTWKRPKVHSVITATCRTIQILSIIWIKGCVCVCVCVCVFSGMYKTACKVTPWTIGRETELWEGGRTEGLSLFTVHTCVPLFFPNERVSLWW